MYSKELDRLIQSVIADGEITEKERAVLQKRARAEGVDADELDVYIDGLVAKAAPAGLTPAQVEKIKAKLQNAVKHW